jgi:tRNA U34 5-methylaminomethyl-2-thiouridine-forming methyltransferase MnmC
MASDHSDIAIITTGDGSHSLLNTALNETYHSVHGAIRESKHVFIKEGLEFFLKTFGKKEVRILEIGFGTGLNAFLSALYAIKLGIQMYYQSWEKFPIGREVYTKLNYADELGSKELFLQLHESAWGKTIDMTEDFSLEKRNGDLIVDSLANDELYDIVFYDAFAPSKQPEMWTLEVLKKTIAQLNRNGVWVTYCAKGQLKRDLKMLGLRVESLPGPPGKREMLRAGII